MKRYKANSPERIWTDKRKELLKTFFAAGYSDKVIAEHINAEDNSTYNISHIINQRIAMDMVRSQKNSIRQSSRTKAKDVLLKSAPRKTSTDIEFKTSFKKGECVYVPGAGLCRYEGVMQLDAGSAAAGVKLLSFSVIETRSRLAKTIRVPEGKVGEKRIRSLMSKEQAREVENILRGNAKTLPFWTRAKTVMKEKLLSPDFRHVAEAARDLISHRTKDGMDAAYSIRQEGENALSLLSAEYARVMNIPNVEAFHRLEKIALTSKRAGAVRELAPAND